MTVNELVQRFNAEFGLDDWPKTYEVDHYTYANVCQYIFKKASNVQESNMIVIQLGIHSGILFKNIELIIKERGNEK